MNNSKPVLLTVSFQRADIPLEQATVASQTSFPMLSYLWERTVAVKKEFSGKLICLRVASMNRPATLLDGDGWLASVSPVRGHQWDVRVWSQNLLNSRVFSNMADRQAAVEMRLGTDKLKLNTWASPEFLLSLELEGPTPNSLG